MPGALTLHLGAVCADVVESLNAILNRACNDHTGRGGGMPGATQVEREAEVVLQVWEWWFLKFDPPLRNYGTPHTAPWPPSRPPVAPHSPLLLPQPQLFVRLAMDPSEMKQMLDDMLKANNQILVWFACARLLVCFD